MDNLTSIDGLCFRNRWHPQETRCSSRAVWRTTGVGTMVDGWEWCEEHKPDSLYLERIHEEPDHA